MKEIDINELTTKFHEESYKIGCFKDLIDVATLIRFNPKTNRIKEIIFFDYIEIFDYEDNCSEIGNIKVKIKLDEKTGQIEKIKAYDYEDSKTEVVEVLDELKGYKLILQKE